jgi:hypothetical protein
MHFLIKFSLIGFNFVILGALGAEIRKQGAFLVLEHEGEIRITDHLRPDEEQAFATHDIKGGITSLKLEESSHTCLLASNKAIFAFYGPASVAFERFEQAPYTFKDGIPTVGESRMIVEVDSGRFLIDAMQLPAASNIVIETRFGRAILSEKAQIIFNLNLNEQRKRYTFELECIKGEIRFNDRSGRHFFLTKRQRLSGYSNKSSFSLGVSPVTIDSINLFQRHVEKLQLAPAAKFDFKVFESHMPKLKQFNDSADLNTEEFKNRAESPEPIIIEFSPRAPSILPIRAIIK